MRRRRTTVHMNGDICYRCHKNLKLILLLQFKIFWLDHEKLFHYLASNDVINILKACVFLNYNPLIYL